MEIRDYWQVFTKKWWVFVICIVLASGAAYGFSRGQQPIYRSSAKIYVVTARPDLGLTLVVKDIIYQYSQQIVSDKFLNQVIDGLRLDRSTEALRKMIKAAGTPDNLAIQVEVDDPSPLAAQRIAKALAAAFIENHLVDMASVDPRDQINLKIYDETRPGAFNRPQTRVNVMAGAVFGLLLGAIIAFLLEYTDDTIKTAEDVERHVALPAMGSIPWLNTAQSRNVTTVNNGLLSRLNVFRR
ncbi:MAG: Wzz/FepE/Etk N-terminal domain-containing protein [Dehalococcoidia bacterium]|nr:Wzz/FepE/Etk N-terminal domain-containing protein [Dehalococcoidia bacterium]